MFNATQQEELRVAIVDGQKLVDLDIESASREQRKSNIYKGIITRIEPSLEAAFIDYGEGINGFLHISDLHPKYFPGAKDQKEKVGRKIPRRARPIIQASRTTPPRAGALRLRTGRWSRAGSGARWWTCS